MKSITLMLCLVTFIGYAVNAQESHEPQIIEIEKTVIQNTKAMDEAAEEKFEMKESVEQIEKIEKTGEVKNTETSDPKASKNCDEEIKSAKKASCADKKESSKKSCCASHGKSSAHCSKEAKKSCNHAH